MIGIFVVILIALVVYILWLHKEGKQYSQYSKYVLTVPSIPLPSFEKTLPASAEPSTLSLYCIGCKYEVTAKPVA